MSDIEDVPAPKPRGRPARPWPRSWRKPLHPSAVAHARWSRSHRRLRLLHLPSQPSAVAHARSWSRRWRSHLLRLRQSRRGAPRSSAKRAFATRPSWSRSKFHSAAPAGRGASRRALPRGPLARRHRSLSQKSKKQRRWALFMRSTTARFPRGRPRWKPSWPAGAEICDKKKRWD